MAAQAQAPTDEILEFKNMVQDTLEQQGVLNNIRVCI